MRAGRALLVWVLVALSAGCGAAPNLPAPAQPAPSRPATTAPVATAPVATAPVATAPVATTTTAACPVTLPLPPDRIPAEAARVIAGGQQNGGDSVPAMFGGGPLWVVVPADGRVRVPRGTDGYEEKFPTVRLEAGQLTAAVRRLDRGTQDAEAAVTIPAGYGDSGFQAFAVTFPSPGCWEITQRLNSDSVTIVVEVLPRQADGSRTTAETTRPPGASHATRTAPAASTTTTGRAGRALAT